LAFENWSKSENIEYVINKYNLEPKDILFIDDNINHIKRTEGTWVNRLYFKDSNIDIEKEIEKY
jgi:FMN phosphatase YigB (HAD superfamily)